MAISPKPAGFGVPDRRRFELGQRDVPNRPYAQEIGVEQTCEALEAAGLSIFNIGVSTGISRETTRRKVRHLVEMNYLKINKKDKSVYIPVSAITKPRMLEILTSHVAEAGALARTIGFYTEDREKS